MAPETHESAPQTDSPPPDLASPGNDVLDVVIPEALLTLPGDRVTEVVCPQCTTKASWKGPFTPDMIARTFTRGFGLGDYPLCPRCGTGMALLAETPIEQAARQVPEKTEPRQPSIPGLRPAFDVDAALRMIDEQEEIASQTERTYERDQERAKASRKIADAENHKLRTLIHDLRARRLDAEFEQRDRAARDPDAIGICFYERKFQKRCTVCRSAVAAQPNADAPSHLAFAAGQDLGLTNTELVELVADVGGVLIDLARVGEWTPEERASVLAWLQTPTLDLAPTCLFPAPEPNVARVPMKRHRSPASAKAAKQAHARHKKKAAKKRGRR